MKAHGKKIINWYLKHKRDLPWRETREPYKIWLSEIILQQTRVDQGLSYYIKFLNLFPDVESLAAAKEDEILKAWQGLGYYSRARNLHFTAKRVVQEFGGEFPKTAGGLLALKGIGPYTAAAIASFCYGEKIPVIDGNVIRVISRLFAIEKACDTPDGKHELEVYSKELIEGLDPGIFNQAMMEFGALQCTPQNPDCGNCPLSANCLAYSIKKVGEFPHKKKKTAVKEIWFYYFVIHHGNDVFIKRRNEPGIWRGLYDFPIKVSDVEWTSDAAIDAFISESDFKGDFEIRSVSEAYIHILSHRRIHAKFIEMRLTKVWKNKPDHFLKVAQKNLMDYGVPRLIERYLQTR